MSRTFDSVLHWARARVTPNPLWHLAFGEEVLCGSLLWSGGTPESYPLGEFVPAKRCSVCLLKIKEMLDL